VTVGLRAGSGSGATEGRARRSPLRRFSLGHIAVVVAAILAFVANVAFLRSRDDATAVLVAARPIVAGETVGPDDLTTTRLRAEPSVMSTLLMSIDGVDGRVARRSLAPGEMVGAGDLLTAAAPGGMASMAVPMDPAHAAGGTIRVGDRVDIVDVDPDGVAGYIVRDAPVLSVSEERVGALAGSSNRHVVIGLFDDEVLAVAEAIADGKVDIVVTTGSAGE
jgi:Flp pilus assembly protein CpaB